MTATKTAASTSPVSTSPAPIQVGKAKAETNTNGFANLLSDSIAKESHVTKVLPEAVSSKTEIPKQVLSELSKSLGDVDLSVLGEVDETEGEGKKSAIKLGDLLAELSHKSEAPVGSEVINLKTILGAKNDDPKLISKDLIALVPKKEQAKVMKSLIEGAKEVLKNQLQGRIPKNRVPKTLKGLLETAVRFNMVVGDLKVENLPQNKITAKLLDALKVKADKEPKLLTKLGTVPTHAALNAMSSKELKAPKEISPLEQILSTKEEDEALVALKPSSAQKMIKPSGEVLKSVEPLETKKDKKADKLASKETLKSLPREARVMQDAAIQPMAKREATLEKLLSTDAESENKASSSVNETSSTSNTAAKIDANPLKAENNLQLKMAESRQLVSQLSADVKEAMESYKPPFTKLSMKLNPERLGEIDVVMVQRGNNVHINLTSNGTALGLLQQNSADLKAALNNVGLSDATMNFSSNGESRNQSQEQQQKHSTAEHYEELAKFMEDLDELEIVVPHYV